MNTGSTLGDRLVINVCFTYWVILVYLFHEISAYNYSNIYIYIYLQCSMGFRNKL